MKLTEHNKGFPKRGQLLTNKKDAVFKMSLERSLENGFCFKDLQKRDIKRFNSFINKTVGNKLTVHQVNQRFGRIPDKNDTIDGYQIYHYKLSDKFRIHGYLKDGYFVICRVDPNHKIH